MKSAIMKVTALSVVLGLGVLVVLQANRPVGDGAKSSGAETPEEVQSADKPADDSDSGRPQPLVSRTGAGPGDDLGDAEGEVGSADRKPTAAVRPQPRRPKSASATAARSPKESREVDLESRFDRLLDDEDPDLTAEKPAAVAVARRDGERGGAASRTAPADDVQEDELRESKRPLAGRPVRPRATGVGRSADDAIEDEEESTGVSKRRTSGGRSRVVSGGETVIAQVNSSWVTRVRRDDLVTFHVDGTHGSAVAGLQSCRAQSRVTTPRPVWNPDVKQSMNFFEHWQEVPDSEVCDNGFKIQWEAFIRHVVEGAPYRWNLVEGAKGVQLVEAALRSWRERRWVDVPPLSL